MNDRSPKRRGCLAWLGGAIIVAGSIVVAVAAAGFVYESVSSKSDHERYPAPGQLVDVGGFALHLYCTGVKRIGQPTVVLAAAGGLASSDWALVQPAVASKARVCSYDRAGYGWSDSGTTPRTSRQIANELDSLLVNAEEQGPYILVGHSFGGHTVRLLASEDTTAVVGMVLVDARPEDMLAFPVLAEIGDGSGSGKFVVLSWLSRLGLPRLLGSEMLPPTFRERLVDYPVAISYRPKYFIANRNEALAIAGSDAQVKDSGPLGSLPLIVIRHGNPDIFAHLSPEEALEAEQIWQESQQRLTELSSNSRMVVATGSGHFVPIDQPEVVVEAIVDLLTMFDRLSARAPAGCALHSAGDGSAPCALHGG